MQINSGILKHIKQKLREKMTDAEIRADIKRTFPEISEDAVADAYVEVAKQDAPRLLYFERLTVLRLRTDCVELRAYQSNGEYVYTRTLTPAQFQLELRDFRDQYQISALMDSVRRDPAEEVDILPQGSVEAFIVRHLELI